ncbi:unnamed protein product, partial [Darwinula stevensoni]
GREVGRRARALAVASLKMLPVFKELFDHVIVRRSHETLQVDGWVFKLHYRFTAGLLVVCCLLVAAHDWIGKPIECTHDKRDKEEFVNAINTYCWISATFTVLEGQTGEDADKVVGLGVGTKKYHAYYQWVLFVLFLQAIFFYLPHLVWKSIEGGKLNSIVQGLHHFKVEDRHRKEELLAAYLEKSLHTHRLWAGGVLSLRIPQFRARAARILPHGLFLRLGPDFLDDSTTLRKTFPLLTKCDFHYYGSSGTIQNLDALCVLPANVVNEKIFVALWFWFLILAVITALGVICRAVILWVSSARLLLLHVHGCERKTVEDVCRRLDWSDWFLLHQLLRALHVDGWMFKLHYRFTTNLLLVLCLLATAHEWVGKSIECTHDREKNKDFAKAVNKYCWISSTYTVRDGQIGQDTGLHDGTKKYHKYYQWVPFFLFLQAIFFYLPHLAWKSLEGGKLNSLLQDLNHSKAEDRHRVLQRLVSYLAKSLHTHRVWAGKFLLCESLNFVHVLVEFFLTDRFIDYKFLRLGQDFLDDSTKLRKIFPMVGKCDFHYYGSSGTIQKLDALCVLHGNALNEKIFVMLWFWFLFLAVLTALGVMCRQVLLRVPSACGLLNVPGCERKKVEDVCRRFDWSDWFLLHHLLLHMDVLVHREFFLELDRTLRVDGCVFKLHYRFTAGLLAAFCLLVAAHDWFGKPIECTHDKRDKKEFVKAINTYCWISATFTVLEGQTGEDADKVVGLGVGTKKYHAYYQWVPFVLFLQAIFFYLPHLVWKSLENGKLHKIVQGLNKSNVKDRDRKEERLAAYLEKSLRTHRVWAWTFLLCESFNFAHVLLELFVTDRFIGRKFLRYGSDFLDDSTTMRKTFPLLGKCDFHRYGPSGTIQNLDALCVLPANVINEKIFVALWFWFIILAVITAAGVICRAVVLCVPRARFLLLQVRGCERKTVEDVCRRLEWSDWFLLRQLLQVMDLLVHREFFLKLDRALNPGNRDGMIYSTS